MYAQIIFFISLAVLIVLIFRRFQVSGRFPQRVGGILQTIGLRLTHLGGRFGNVVVEQAKKASGFRPNIGVPTRETVAKSPFAPGSHKFWQEESTKDRSDLTSNFDEGDSLFKQENYKEAEQFFLKAASSHPNDPRIYARLGVIYLNEKNYNDAIESLKVAVKLDKYNPSRHYNLALAYRGNKDKQRAISSVREAISLDPITEKYRQFLETLLESK